nr:MAG TPA: hypothetical protein [Caudoviricetes sp.]
MYPNQDCHLHQYDKLYLPHSVQEHNHFES